MGFFASRWIEKHGAETEKAALTTTPPTAAPGPPPKTKWYSRKKETADNEHAGGQPHGHNGKPNRAATMGDNKSMKEKASSRNPVNYATWGSSSKSAVVPASKNELGNGYGTIRKASVGSYGSGSAPQRPATDSVTVTLAQKLDELATANADGLLSDDEYRLLRQNLFERFGSVAAQIPAEQSLISLPSPSSRKALNTPSDRQQQQPASSIPQGDSNFTISRSKSTRSMRSTASRGSSVQTAITSLIRKATRRESISAPRPSFAGSGNDADSTYSRGSRNSSIFPRGGLPRTLVHKASAGSMQTSPSIINGPSAVAHAYDVRSISSRRTHKSGVDSATIVSRATSRSRPPSSYHRRRAPSEAGASDEIGADWTAAELRSEIQSLEEENKRLMDMFNGLEMTTLMKSGPISNGNGRSLFEGKNLSSDWTILPDAKKIPTAATAAEKSSSRLSISSSSMRSFAGLQRKGSLGFLSSKRSQLPPLPPIPTSATSVSTFSSMPNSATSMTMSPTGLIPTSASTTSSLHPHPHPLTVAGGSQSNRSSPNLAMDRGAGSLSSGKLTRSRSGYIGTNHGRGEGSSVGVGIGRGDDVGADDPEQSGLEDIRRKRASVVLRYEKRLEYLRARLRSAELHERLLK